MKIIKEKWSDEKSGFIQAEISEKIEVNILSRYANANELVKVQCYYRLPYGGIDAREV